MRIALVTPELPGCGASHGIGDYVDRLRHALTVRGDACLTLAVGGDGCWRAEGDAPAACHVRARWPALLRPYAAARWLTGQLAAWRPDVVEMPNWGGLGAGLRLTTPCVVRLSTSIHDDPQRGSLRRLAAAAHLRAERITVGRATLAITHSRAMADLSRTIYARTPDLIVPHGIAAPHRAPSTGSDLLFVGRFDPRKGIDTLVEAWRLLGDRRGSCIMHLVGVDLGWPDPALDPPQTRRHGRLDGAQLETLRAACGIQVVPSRFESFGLVLLEAWAAGLAAVAADGGALPEVAGDAAVIFPAGDPAALAEALAGLIADPAARQRLAVSGNARLLAAFGEDAFVDGTREAYRLALTPRR